MKPHHNGRMHAVVDGYVIKVSQLEAHQEKQHQHSRKYDIISERKYYGIHYAGN